MAAYQTNPVTLVLIVRIPAEGIENFRAYEDAVLPLLPEINGRLERRLRNPDGAVEMHTISFACDADFGMILGVQRKSGCWKNHLRCWNCFRWRTSLNGTKLTSQSRQLMSALWGRADITWKRRYFRF